MRNPNSGNKSTCRHLVALVLVLCLIATPAVAEPDVGCARCIVVDGSGKVLWSRAPRDRYPNASTTKMVTAILTMREADPDDVVTVSATAASIGGGGLDLTAGDTFTVDALMHALLLDSSNEAAMAFAEFTSGSASAFVKEMNRYVASIGADRTHFANPHGLDAEGHYSTAHDLATIGAELLQNEYLAEVVATAETTIATPGGTVSIENRNLLLEGYEGAIGIKTGRTLGAGNVLVAAARRGDELLITVAMNSYDTFADSAVMLDWGFAKLRRMELNGVLVKEGHEVGELVFETGSIPIAAGATLRGRLPLEPGALELDFVASHTARLPITSGDEIGLVRVLTERGVAGSVPAVAAGTVTEEVSEPWWSAPVVGLVRLFGGVLR